jgi:hypothetical protein
MGGYVNLVVRKDGQVKKTLAYTGVISRFYTPDLYLEDQGAIDGLLQMYEDCPEQQDPECRTLAPYHYGLIVLDFDRKTVLDMQVAACTNMFSALSPSSGWTHVQRMGQMGWLGPGLHDLYTGEFVIPFPEKVFVEPTALMPWLRAQEKKSWKGSSDGDFPISKSTLLAFKLFPPGWRFLTFEREEALKYLKTLEEFGFAISAEEQLAWDEWIKSHFQLDSE